MVYRPIAENKTTYLASCWPIIVDPSGSLGAYALFNKTNDKPVRLEQVGKYQTRPTPRRRPCESHWRNAMASISLYNRST